MEKRYQVFVSSTYEDLQVERQEVMRALLELDCMPSGMELFPAADASQWSVIKRVISDCDYYVLIVGGRYGSIGPDGISYTEMEYREAVQAGKPTIAFLHKDPGQLPANKCEATEEGRRKLAEFRSLVQKKLCKHWTSPSDLGSVVSRSLIQLIKTTPAIGWVRADELPDKGAMLELLRLRKQVEELETDLARARTTAPKGTEDLAQGEDSVKLTYTFGASSPGAYKTTMHQRSFVTTWNDLFGSLAPLMINEASESALNQAMDSFVASKNQQTLMKEKLFESHQLYQFSLGNEDFQTVKVQLRALGLITKSERARSVKDVDTYWTLTPYGDEIMTRLRAIKRVPAAEVAKPASATD